MMRRSWLLALALLALGASPALAGKGNSFLDREAPEIQVPEWLNRPEKTDVASHRGEVLLLEFFATW